MMSITKTAAVARSTGKRISQLSGKRISELKHQSTHLNLPSPDITQILLLGQVENGNG